MAADGKLIFDTKIDMDGINKGTSSITSKLSSAGKKIGSTITGIIKGIGVAAAATSAGLVAVGKKALESYANYEQLVGGVETLFGDMSDQVIENSQKAYKTAGVSANEYLDTVMSFSASLNQSLKKTDGNLSRSAKLSNQIIIDMADNANKMGTDMKSIQNAYQGFAKQNYTMLDNLKLGYGGTKQEMERLLADAEKLTGKKFDISNFSDVAEAIHAIQTEIGITGTTAEEASSTIQGSISSMKSAWTNLLTGLADPKADINKLIQELVDSMGTAAKNIMPKVKQIATGIGSAFKNYLSKINWKGVWINLTGSITDALKSLTDFFGLKGITTTKLKTALQDIYKPASELYKTFKESLTELLKPLIDDFLPQAVNLLGSFLKALKPIISAAAPILKKAVEVISKIIGSLAPVLESIGSLIGEIIEDASPVLQPIMDLIGGIVQLLAPAVKLIADMVKSIGEFLSPINQIVGGIIGLFTGGGSEPTISDKIAKELDDLSNISDDLTNVRDNIKNAIDSVDENLAATRDDIGYIDTLKNRMDELLKKSTLSDAEMQELKTIADLISEKLPEFETTWNSMTTKDSEGKLVFTKNRKEIISSIDSMIEKLKEQYLVEALGEQQKQLIAERAKATSDYSQAVGELSGKQLEYQKAVDEVNDAESRLALSKQTLAEKESSLSYDEYNRLKGEIAEGEKRVREAKANLAPLKSAYEEAQQKALEAAGKQGELNKKIEQMSNAMEIGTKGFDPLFNDLQQLRDAADLGVIDVGTIEKQYGITAQKLYAGSRNAAQQSTAGYEQGIKDGAQQLSSMGIQIADKVLDGARKGFDEHSPSKKFEEIGDYSVQGLELGIKGRTPTVLSLVKSLATKMTDAMREGLKQFGATFNVLPDLVKNKFNLVLNLFEDMLSRMTSGINQTFLQINSLNKAFATSAGKNQSYTTWSPVSMIHIPRLATGTVVPANYGEFLAVLGDNKREAEVVSPMSDMKQAFLEALAENDLSGGNGEKEINLYIDGEKFFSWLISKNNQYTKSHGYPAFSGGEA